MSRPSRRERPYRRIKVISMGGSGVGKSCLIKRYCEKKFVSRWISTIGVDFGVRNVRLDDHPQQELKVNFWDFSGHRGFVEVRSPFYADAEGAILVYDVTNRKSFEALNAWVREWKKYGSKSMHVCVCANKVDLVESSRATRQVSEAEGKKWADKLGATHCETSANDGRNVADMFQTLFQRCIHS